MFPCHEWWDMGSKKAKVSIKVLLGESIWVASLISFPSSFGSQAGHETLEKNLQNRLNKKYKVQQHKYNYKYLYK